MHNYDAEQLRLIMISFLAEFEGNWPLIGSLQPLPFVLFSCFRDTHSESLAGSKWKFPKIVSHLF